MPFQQRIISVDFLRGLTVTGMIFVNNPGSWEYIYPVFRHAHWNGCRLADLVFPFFLFIAGISINYSLGNYTLPKADKVKTAKRILKRGFTIIIIGILLNSFPFYDFSGQKNFTDLLSNFRIMGVLQRIGIVFIISALLFIYTSPRIQLIAAVSILIVYSIMMTMIPVPGIGYAGLEPTTNLSGYIDRMILGEHIWIWSREWGDPEGLLSTIPAISSGISGILAGFLLKEQIDSYKKVTKLFLYGICLTLSGTLLSFLFPINKSLWTSSYVLLTTGIAMAVLSFCYWLIDVKRHTQIAEPFVAFGSNAITAYLLSEILSRLADVITVTALGQSAKEFLYISLSGFISNPYVCSLTFALLWVSIAFIPIWILFRKKIFIKI